MSYQIDLEGKTAIVTGGTRGIGAAIADAFAVAGADIVITGTQRESVTRRVEALRETAKGRVEGWVADFTTSTGVQDVCEKIRAMNCLHILVNNAGTNRIHPISEVKSSDLSDILALNLQAPTLLTGAAASVMKTQRWGRILNIASIWSVITKPGRAMYSASKFGLVGLTKTTAVDLGGDNILANALSPGFTLTDLTMDTVPIEEQNRIAEIIPMGRFAKVEEMAKVALFLCSDFNTYITGQNIVVDGGYVSV